MLIGIYSRLGNEKQEQRLIRIIGILRERVRIALYAPLYPYISEKYGLRLAADELFGSAVDLPAENACMLSVGGDGTMLDAAALSVHSGIPIIGFSTGRLGFLPMLNDDTLETALDAIIGGSYDVEYRTMLMLQTDNCHDDGCIALNDVCLQKRGSPIAEINVTINGEFLCTYWADGLIVSTPTGSTAYSLSAGGPIVSPQSECFVVLPIAPHNLNVRPVIVPDSSVIVIGMRTRSKTIVISADSKEYERPDDVLLTIKKFGKKAGFIKLQDMNFYGILRDKMLWGVETRRNA
jgi:NAD+ kinase